MKKQKRVLKGEIKRSKKRKWENVSVRILSLLDRRGRRMCEHDARISAVISIGSCAFKICELVRYGVHNFVIM